MSDNNSLILTNVSISFYVTLIDLNRPEMVNCQNLLVTNF